MKVFCLLLVLVGFSDAGHGPVYRQAPPLVGAKSWEMNPPTQNPTTPKAEERQESQAYMSDIGGKTTVLSSSGLSTLSGTSSGLQNTVLPTVSTMTKPESEYKVYRIHQGPGANPATTTYQLYAPQPMETNTYPMTYQQNPAVVAPGISHFWNKINWMDVLVGTSSVALVGLGSAMAYPYLRSAFGVRMMRELAEMNREDATRMAKSVMTAIQRISELNNQSEVVADGPAESEE